MEPRAEGIAETARSILTWMASGVVIGAAISVVVVDPEVPSRIKTQVKKPSGVLIYPRERMDEFANLAVTRLPAMRADLESLRGKLGPDSPHDQELVRMIELADKTIALR